MHSIQTILAIFILKTKFFRKFSEAECDFRLNLVSSVHVRKPAARFAHKNKLVDRDDPTPNTAGGELGGTQATLGGARGGEGQMRTNG